MRRGQKIIAKWAEVRGTGTEWAAMEPVPGIEGSRCHKQEDKPGTDDAKTYYACLFTVGDYAVDVAATQKAQIVQKASAQYLLLTAK